MGQGLENARRLYLEGIEGGDARVAIGKYTGHRYTQHSTGVADGIEGFLTFFEPFLERNPKRKFEVMRIFEEGRWVFCHVYQSLNDGEAQWVTADMFYTDENGLILEHWDTITPYVTDTQSGEDMVRGASEVDVSADSDANKAVVLEYTKSVRQEGDVSKIDQFVSADLIEHSAQISTGRDGLVRWLTSKDAGQFEFLFNIMADGDFVVTYSKRHAYGKDIAAFDIYRLRDGRIVEHWCNEEEIGPRETWGNSGKF